MLFFRAQGKLQGETLHFCKRYGIFIYVLRNAIPDLSFIKTFVCYVRVMHLFELFYVEC